MRQKEKENQEVEKKILQGTTGKNLSLIISVLLIKTYKNISVRSEKNREAIKEANPRKILT